MRLVPPAAAALAAGALLAVPTAAHAAPQVAAAYAFQRPASDSVVVVYRLASGAPGRTWIGGQSGFSTLVSPARRCYEVSTSRAAKPGSKLTFRSGSFKRRLVVHRYSAKAARGQRIGCGGDPVAGTVTFNLTATPLVTPERYFFSANAGPYLRDLTWTGWGTATAVGTGRFMSDCASCGPKEDVEATLTLTEPRWCAAYGVRVYDAMVLERVVDGAVKRTELPGDWDTSCG